MVSTNLEQAENPTSLRRVVIEPVTRVEGHGKVTILLDADNKVHQVRLHIVEFRGFERFICGRPYWEVPVMVQRLCGICPVSHHLAAAKALDGVVGVPHIPATAERIRRLMHYGQVLQSHALHFYHLASPDLLFGFGSEPARRNIVGVLERYPDVAKQGVLLRKFGQEAIRITAGKRVHGTGAIPGGVNKAVTKAERDELAGVVAQVLSWAERGVALVAELHAQNAAAYERFGTVPSNLLSLVGGGAPAQSQGPHGSQGAATPERRPLPPLGSTDQLAGHRPGPGELDLYDGVLRARDPRGALVFDGVPPEGYGTLLREDVRSWSYMKFPFIETLGRESGWYKVGPLARVQNCDRIPTPRAEAARQELLAGGHGQVLHAPLFFHWARLIELLHAAEVIAELLGDPLLLGTDLVGTELLGADQGRARGVRSGVGIIEAPRGTLIHHYEVGEDDLVTHCNLIVSTTHNNQAMNEAIRQVAREYLDGHEPTEALLNHIEVAIRAFDPCLSCATHALGKMPLQVDVVDAQGGLRQRLVREAEQVT